MSGYKSISCSCFKEFGAKFKSSELKAAKQGKLIFFILGAQASKLLIFIMDIKLSDEVSIFTI